MRPAVLPAPAWCLFITAPTRPGRSPGQGDPQSDLVVTTYALANRDRDQLGLVRVGRIVLDEAQYIKNPAAKQTQAVRSLKASGASR
jgi:SNF2 family DNA or RNA helicase